MATLSRKSCALRDFLGFEWPDDDYYETLAPTGLDKNTFACFCMRPALPGELYEIFCPPWGTVWEFGPHNRAPYGIYTGLYMVLLLWRRSRRLVITRPSERLLEYVKLSGSFVSLWLQVISLPPLCRKYQQTLEISRGTWPILLFLRTATAKSLWMFWPHVELAALLRCRETTKLCKCDVHEQYSQSCINCFV